MDPKIIKILEQLIAKTLKNVATKDDLKNFATKDDLSRFVTKDDLTAMEKRIDQNFATKNDLVEMTINLKRELHDTRDKLLEKIEDVDNGIGILLQSTQDHKADKKELILLRRRIEKLERKVFTN